MAFDMTRTVLSTVAKNSQVNADAASQANGKLQWYSAGGTPDTPSGTLLVEFNLGANPYSGASNATAPLASPLTGTAVAAGTPSIYRILNSSNTFLHGGTIANSSAVALNQQMQVTSFPINHP